MTRSASSASMRQRTLGVVPAAWTSKRPPSIGPAFRSTSGGCITGPVFVSAASRASAHGRMDGKSSARRARVGSTRDAGKTPSGRLAARTGAETLVTPVFRARYGSVPVSASANGRFALAETGTLPYLARKTGVTSVSAPVRAANLPLGVFPASRVEPTRARLAELFPSIRPCADALDAALTNAGPVMHPPLVLLNAGPIDGGRFDVHAAGTTPSVRRLIDALDAERVMTREGWGYPAPHYELATHYDEARAAEGLYGAGARAKLLASGLWSEILTFEHRYVTEDVAFGLALFESAGRAGGVDTPGVSGLLLTFQALLGRELSGRGRALEHLGLGDFSRREIRGFLEQGWESPFWAKVIR